MKQDLENKKLNSLNIKMRFLKICIICVLIKICFTKKLASFINKCLNKEKTARKIDCLCGKPEVYIKNCFLLDENKMRSFPGYF